MNRTEQKEDPFDRQAVQVIVASQEAEEKS